MNIHNYRLSNKAIAFLFMSATALFISSCGNNSSEKKESYKVDPLVKRALGSFSALSDKAENTENPITEAKVLLGKTLYFDNRLSKNNTQSCNTCHSLSTFGVDNKATSAGDLGKNGTRNSPTVLNAAFHTTQFWDGRAKDVEEQAGMPITNPVEMNMPSESFVEERVKGIPGYTKLFTDAFPGEENPIQYKNLKKAIGAFERTLATPTKFDKFLQGDVEALTAEEKAGLTKFMDLGCTTCHIGPAVGGTMFQRFPLVGDDYKTLTGSKNDDKGVMEVSKKEDDKYMFKVPSLRNITKTGPYFHDGSVADLNAAIKIMAKLELNKDVSDEDVKAIALFLNTLTGEVAQSTATAPEMPK
jgi:cytochrome c peroxidase